MHEPVCLPGSTRRQGGGESGEGFGSSGSRSSGQGVGIALGVGSQEPCCMSSGPCVLCTLLRPEPGPCRVKGLGRPSCGHGPRTALAQSVFLLGRMSVMTAHDIRPTGQHTAGLTVALPCACLRAGRSECSRANGRHVLGPAGQSVWQARGRWRHPCMVGTNIRLFARTCNASPAEAGSSSTSGEQVGRQQRMHHRSSGMYARMRGMHACMRGMHACMCGMHACTHSNQQVGMTTLALVHRAPVSHACHVMHVSHACHLMPFSHACHVMPFSRASWPGHVPSGREVRGR